VIALVAAFNEEDVIGQVIGDLIAQGLSVYLLDDGSTDATVEEARRFEGSGLIAVEQLVKRRRGERLGPFRWEHILGRKEELARELDGDWFLHSDADELRESPWPDRSLAEAVAAVDRLGYNAIDFRVFNFPPTRDGFARGDDLRTFFRHFEPGAVFDKLQVKCWKKHPGIDLRSTGGHDAQFPQRRVFPVRFLLRHYPIRSQAHGERKVFRERKPRFVEAERKKSWHIQYDGMEPGHRFLRSTRQLEKFDLEAARLSVWTQHRGVEEAQQLAAERERALDEARRALDEMRRARDAELRERQHVESELSRERERIVALTGDTERSGRELDELRRALAETRQAADAERERLETELARAHARIGEVERGIGAAERETAALKQELSGVRRALDEEQRAHENLRQDHARLAAEAERTRAELDQQRQALDGSRRALETTGAELHEARARLLAAEARLDDLFGSRTWRWSSPARLAWRLIGRE
jgi:hypothetical protein